MMPPPMGMPPGMPPPWFGPQPGMMPPAMAPHPPGPGMLMQGPTAPPVPGCPPGPNQLPIPAQPPHAGVQLGIPPFSGLPPTAASTH